MRVLSLLALVALLAGLPGTALADIYETTGLSDMDHGRFYTWRIGGLSIPSDSVLVSANLKFWGLYNWIAGENNQIWIHLLDTALYSGVSSRSDSHAWSDAFRDPAGPDTVVLPATYLVPQGTGNTFLALWEDIPGPASAKIDKVYTFDSVALAALSSYITNGGNIAFGVDPDCHFYDTKVSFEMTFRPVPEPSSVVLLGTFLLAGLGALRRKLLA